MRIGRVRRATGRLATVLVLALAAGGCSGDSGAEPQPDSTSGSGSATGPATGSSTPESPTGTPAPSGPLTFGVYGPPAELAAFEDTVEEWNAQPDTADVELRTWPSGRAMRRAVEAGAPLPDVFLASRSDLRWLLDQDLTRPVDELLDDRGVEFGDRYSRDAIRAFSTDERLQCMPYGLSPMVMYYNTRLVNFDRMRKRGLDVPDPDSTSWSFDQFAAAARFAAGRRGAVAGVQVPATLEGLAPFIASGGGSVFNDGSDPTSLSFSSGDSQAALQRTLDLLRDPGIALSEDELAEASPLTWFERGRLGMIPGFRDLVPQLRSVPGLEFDVMAMPSLGDTATVGDVSGLCLSQATRNVPQAADFMVHEIAPESVARVTRTGYLYPANLQIGLTNDFLQPGRQPEHADAFNSAVRSMQLPPLIDDRRQLERAIAPYLHELVYGVGALDLEGLTARIDARSRAILDPAEPSGSPEPSEPSEPSESSASVG